MDIFKSIFKVSKNISTAYDLKILYSCISKFEKIN